MPESVQKPGVGAQSPEDALRALKAAEEEMKRVAFGRPATRYTERLGNAFKGAEDALRICRNQADENIKRLRLGAAASQAAIAPIDQMRSELKKLDIKTGFAPLDKRHDDYLASIRKELDATAEFAKAGKVAEAAMRLEKARSMMDGLGRVLRTEKELASKGVQPAIIAYADGALEFYSSKQKERADLLLRACGLYAEHHLTMGGARGLKLQAELAGAVAGLGNVKLAIEPKTLRSISEALDKVPEEAKHARREVAEAFDAESWALRAELAKKGQVPPALGKEIESLIKDSAGLDADKIAAMKPDDIRRLASRILLAKDAVRAAAEAGSESKDLIDKAYAAALSAQASGKPDRADIFRLAASQIANPPVDNPKQYRTLIGAYLTKYLSAASEEERSAQEKMLAERMGRSLCAQLEARGKAIGGPLGAALLDAASQFSKPENMNIMGLESSNMLLKESSAFRSQLGSARALGKERRQEAEAIFTRGVRAFLSGDMRSSGAQFTLAAGFLDKSVKDAQRDEFIHLSEKLEKDPKQLDVVRQYLDIHNRANALRKSAGGMRGRPEAAGMVREIASELEIRRARLASTGTTVSQEDVQAKVALLNRYMDADSAFRGQIYRQAQIIEKPVERPAVKGAYIQAAPEQGRKPVAPSEAPAKEAAAKAKEAPILTKDQKEAVDKVLLATATRIVLAEERSKIEQLHRIGETATSVKGDRASRLEALRMLRDARTEAQEGRFQDSNALNDAAKAYLRVSDLKDKVAIFKICVDGYNNRKIGSPVLSREDLNQISLYNEKAKLLAQIPKQYRQNASAYFDLAIIAARRVENPHELRVVASAAFAYAKLAAVDERKIPTEELKKQRKEAMAYLESRFGTYAWLRGPQRLIDVFSEGKDRLEPKGGQLASPLASALLSGTGRISLSERIVDDIERKGMIASLTKTLGRTPTMDETIQPIAQAGWKNLSGLAFKVLEANNILEKLDFENGASKLSGYNEKHRAAISKDVERERARLAKAAEGAKGGVLGEYYLRVRDGTSSDFMLSSIAKARALHAKGMESRGRLAELNREFSESASLALTKVGERIKALREGLNEIGKRNVDARLEKAKGDEKAQRTLHSDLLRFHIQRELESSTRMIGSAKAMITGLEAYGRSIRKIDTLNRERGRLNLKEAIDIQGAVAEGKVTDFSGRIVAGAGPLTAERAAALSGHATGLAQAGVREVALQQGIAAQRNRLLYLAKKEIREKNFERSSGLISKMISHLKDDPTIFKDGMSRKVYYFTELARIIGEKDPDKKALRLANLYDVIRLLLQGQAVRYYEPVQATKEMELVPYQRHNTDDLVFYNTIGRHQDYKKIVYTAYSERFAYAAYRIGQVSREMGVDQAMVENRLGHMDLVSRNRQFYEQYHYDPLVVADLAVQTIANPSEREHYEKRLKEFANNRSDLQGMNIFLSMVASARDFHGRSVMKLVQENEPVYYNYDDNRKRLVAAMGLIRSGDFKAADSAMDSYGREFARSMTMERYRMKAGEATIEEWKLYDNESGLRDKLIDKEPPKENPEQRGFRYETNEAAEVVLRTLGKSFERCRENLRSVKRDAIDFVHALGEGRKRDIPPPDHLDTALKNVLEGNKREGQARHIAIMHWEDVVKPSLQAQLTIMAGDAVKEKTLSMYARKRDLKGFHHYSVDAFREITLDGMKFIGAIMLPENAAKGYTLLSGNAFITLPTLRSMMGGREASGSELQKVLGKDGTGEKGGRVYAADFAKDLVRRAAGEHFAFAETATVSGKKGLGFKIISGVKKYGPAVVSPAAGVLAGAQEEMGGKKLSGPEAMGEMQDAAVKFYFWRMGIYVKDPVNPAENKPGGYGEMRDLSQDNASRFQKAEATYAKAMIQLRNLFMAKMTGTPLNLISDSMIDSSHLSAGAIEKLIYTTSRIAFLSREAAVDAVMDRPKDAEKKLKELAVLEGQARKDKKLYEKADQHAGVLREVVKFAVATVATVATGGYAAPVVWGAMGAEGVYLGMQEYEREGVLTFKNAAGMTLSAASVVTPFVGWAGQFATRSQKIFNMMKAGGAAGQRAERIIAIQSAIGTGMKGDALRRFASASVQDQGLLLQRAQMTQAQLSAGQITREEAAKVLGSVPKGQRLFHYVNPVHASRVEALVHYAGMLQIIGGGALFALDAHELVKMGNWSALAHGALMNVAMPGAQARAATRGMRTVGPHEYISPIRQAANALMGTPLPDRQQNAEALAWARRQKHVERMAPGERADYHKFVSEKRITFAKPEAEVAVLRDYAAYKAEKGRGATFGEYMHSEREGAKALRREAYEAGYQGTRHANVPLEHLDAPSQAYARARGQGKSGEAAEALATKRAKEIVIEPPEKAREAMVGKPEAQGLAGPDGKMVKGRDGALIKVYIVKEGERAVEYDVGHARVATDVAVLAERIVKRPLGKTLEAAAAEARGEMRWQGPPEIANERMKKVMELALSKEFQEAVNKPGGADRKAQLKIALEKTAGMKEFNNNPAVEATRVRDGIERIKAAKGLTSADVDLAAIDMQGRSEASALKAKQEDAIARWMRAHKKTEQAEKHEGNAARLRATSAAYAKGADELYAESSKRRGFKADGAPSSGKDTLSNWGLIKAEKGYKSSLKADETYSREVYSAAVMLLRTRQDLASGKAIPDNVPEWVKTEAKVLADSPEFQKADLKGKMAIALGVAGKNREGFYQSEFGKGSVERAIIDLGRASKEKAEWLVGGEVIKGTSEAVTSRAVLKSLDSWLESMDRAGEEVDVVYLNVDKRKQNAINYMFGMGMGDKAIEAYMRVIGVAVDSVKGKKGAVMLRVGPKSDEVIVAIVVPKGEGERVRREMSPKMREAEKQVFKEFAGKGKPLEKAAAMLDNPRLIVAVGETVSDVIRIRKAPDGSVRAIGVKGNDLYDAKVKRKVDGKESHEVSGPALSRSDDPEWAPGMRARVNIKESLDLKRGLEEANAGRARAAMEKERQGTPLTADEKKLVDAIKARVKNGEDPNVALSNEVNERTLIKPDEVVNGIGIEIRLSHTDEKNRQENERVAVKAGKGYAEAADDNSGLRAANTNYGHAGANGLINTVEAGVKDFVERNPDLTVRRLGTMKYVIEGADPSLYYTDSKGILRHPANDALDRSINLALKTAGIKMEVSKKMKLVKLERIPGYDALAKVGNGHMEVERRPVGDPRATAFDRAALCEMANRVINVIGNLSDAQMKVFLGEEGYKTLKAAGIIDMIRGGKGYEHFRGEKGTVLTNFEDVVTALRVRVTKDKGEDFANKMEGAFRKFVIDNLPDLQARAEAWKSGKGGAGAPPAPARVEPSAAPQPASAGLKPAAAARAAEAAVGKPVSKPLSQAQTAPRGPEGGAQTLKEPTRPKPPSEGAPAPKGSAPKPSSAQKGGAIDMDALKGELTGDPLYARLSPNQKKIAVESLKAKAEEQARLERALEMHLRQGLSVEAAIQEATTVAIRDPLRAKKIEKTLIGRLAVLDRDGLFVRSTIDQKVARMLGDASIIEMRALLGLEAITEAYRQTIPKGTPKDAKGFTRLAETYGKMPEAEMHLKLQVLSEKQLELSNAIDVYLKLADPKMKVRFAEEWAYSMKRKARLSEIEDSKKRMTQGEYQKDEKDAIAKAEARMGLARGTLSGVYKRGGMNGQIAVLERLGIDVSSFKKMDAGLEGPGWIEARKMIRERVGIVFDLVLRGDLQGRIAEVARYGGMEIKGVEFIGAASIQGAYKVTLKKGDVEKTVFVKMENGTAAKLGADLAMEAGMFSPEIHAGYRYETPFKHKDGTRAKQDFYFVDDVHGAVGSKIRIMDPRDGKIKTATVMGVAIEEHILTPPQHPGEWPTPQEKSRYIEDVMKFLSNPVVKAYYESLKTDGTRNDFFRADALYQELSRRVLLGDRHYGNTAKMLVRFEGETGNVLTSQPFDTNLVARDIKRSRDGTLDATGFDVDASRLTFHRIQGIAYATSRLSNDLVKALGLNVQSLMMQTLVNNFFSPRAEGGADIPAFSDNMKARIAAVLKGNDGQRFGMHYDLTDGIGSPHMYGGRARPADENGLVWFRYDEMAPVFEQAGRPEGAAGLRKIMRNYIKLKGDVEPRPIVEPRGGPTAGSSPPQQAPKPKTPIPQSSPPLQHGATASKPPSAGSGPTLQDAPRSGGPRASGPDTTPGGVRPGERQPSGAPLSKTAESGPMAIKAHEYDLVLIARDVALYKDLKAQGKVIPKSVEENQKRYEKMGIGEVGRKFFIEILSEEPEFIRYSKGSFKDFGAQLGEGGRIAALVKLYGGVGDSLKPVEQPKAQTVIERGGMPPEWEIRPPKRGSITMSDVQIAEMARDVALKYLDVTSKLTLTQTERRRVDQNFKRYMSMSETGVDRDVIFKLSIELRFDTDLHPALRDDAGFKALMGDPKRGGREMLDKAKDAALNPRITVPVSDAELGVLARDIIRYSDFIAGKPVTFTTLQEYQAKAIADWYSGLPQDSPYRKIMDALLGDQKFVSNAKADDTTFLRFMNNNSREGGGGIVRKAREKTVEAFGELAKGTKP
ncbi:MAG: proline-rich domain-containing protein [Candidatus Micrarchaeota archaeon]